MHNQDFYQPSHLFNHSLSGIKIVSHGPLSHPFINPVDFGVTKFFLVTHSNLDNFYYGGVTL